MKLYKTLILCLILLFFPAERKKQKLGKMKQTLRLHLKYPLLKHQISLNVIGIADFGARKDDKDATTQAISEANKYGGGTVVIPKGEWLTKKNTS